MAEISFVIAIKQTNHFTNQKRPCTTLRGIMQELSIWQSSPRPGLVNGVNARVVRLSPVFSGRVFVGYPVMACHTVLVRSSDREPSGSLRFTQVRNQPALLDPAWNGFSSLLTAKFLLRVTDSARTPSEELVNSASKSESKSVFKGVGPTSLSRPFPGHPGVS